MAVVTYVGKQIARAWQKTLTVGTASPAGTITATGGNGQAVVVTPTTTDPTTTAGEIVTAMQNAGGVFTELAISSIGAIITLIGPSDGAIVTFSKTDGSANVTTLATVFAPLSPSDVADPLNYSTGLLPVSTVDSLTFEDSSVSLKYNLTALAAITLAAPGLTRRTTFTGQIGIPTTNPLGFPEYRDTELSIKADTYLWESSPSDGAQEFRILNTFSASAVTVTVQGSGSNAQVGQESLQIRGLPAASIVTVIGGSLTVAPLQGQACTILTLVAVDGTLSIGPSTTLSGTVKLVNCNARIKSSWTTSLTMNGGTVEIAGSAAGVIVNEGGRLVWRSTGNPGASPILGSGALLDLSQSPATLTISGTIQMYAGSALYDPAGRGGNWAVKTVHCRIDEVTITTEDNGTYTKS